MYASVWVYLMGLGWQGKLGSDLNKSMCASVWVYLMGSQEQLGSDLNKSMCASMGISDVEGGGGRDS